MKRIIAASIVILTFALAGCGFFHRRQVAQKDTKAGTYAGPKAVLTLADFGMETLKVPAEVGKGLREMLVSALMNSNRFHIIELQPGDSARKADLIIVAAVNEFQPWVSGGKAGIGGGGGAGSGMLGGLSGIDLSKARIALDIRILDARTSRVLARNKCQGQASDIAGSFMGQGLGSGLSIYANTPMEKAIHICITEATRNISQDIPEHYYKH